jgi:hypothetical protein
MKTIKILLPPSLKFGWAGVILILLHGNSFAQNIYEVTPGTKGNEINLTLANISEANQAANINVALTKKSTSLTFNKEEETLDMIEAKAEAETKFIFEVNRNTQINKRDTVEFMITSPDGIMVTKQFIFSYTGPKEFKLEQNFPNPFNPTTKIQYQLPQDAKVTLKVYDILGSEVATLVNEEQEAGFYEVKFSAKGGSASGGNATNIASGMYVYRLQAGDYVSVKKMLMVK